MIFRRSVAVALLLGIGLVWATPCPTGRVALRASLASPTGSAAHHVDHAPAHASSGHDAHPEEVAEVPGLRQPCGCGCEARPDAVGVSLSPGWALIPASAGSLEPGSPTRPAPPLWIASDVSLGVPEPIPLPS